MTRSSILIVSTLLLAACQAGPDSGGTPGNESARSGAANEAGITYAQTVSADQLPQDFARLPMKEFMGHVMQFTADQFWKWQGYVNDEKGERSLYPKTDEEWEEAESGALTLAEMTNVLLMPGRRVDDPRWDEAVAGVRKLALQGAAAAEKHDAEGMFEVGGALDEACDACHSKFIPNFVGPGSQAAGAAAQ